MTFFLKWTVGTATFPFSFPYQFSVSFYRQLFCTFFSFLIFPTPPSTLLSVDFALYFTENVENTITDHPTHWVHLGYTHTPYHVSQLTF